MDQIRQKILQKTIQIMVFFCGKFRNKNQVKASLTVEASILIPMILFTIVGGIKIGYRMFEEAKTTTEIHEELVKLDPVAIVRRNTLIQGHKNE